MRNIRLLILTILLLFLAVSLMPLKAQIPAWQPNTAYSVGALVTYGGSTYRCTQAHTSLIGWEPPNVPALWSLETAPTNTPAGATFTPTYTPTKTNTPGAATNTPTPVPTNTPTTAPNGSNLALNKPASASGSCASTEGPDKAVNGSISGGNSDKWCAGGSPKWMQVDLSTNYTLNQFIIKHAGAGGENASWNTNAFTIQLSTDNVNWGAAVVNVSGNTANITNHTISPVTGRYVRLNITNAGTDGVARIYEFEVYGSFASVPTNTNTPAPVPTNTPSGTGNCYGYPAWTPTASYIVGDIVYYVHNWSYYQVAHTDSGTITNVNPTASPWYWQPYSCTQPVPTPPASCTGFGCVMTQAQFDARFRLPYRNSFYTFANFLTARNSYPGFAGGSDLALNKREAAAFFAHVAHETSYLLYIDEQNYIVGHYCEVTGNGPQYGCASGADYHGRGPLQISWNYNYKMASNGNYYSPTGWQNIMNPTVGTDIWSNPNAVATDGVLAWKTALWYWMTHGKDWDPAKPTVHDDILNVGFGQTTRDINGGLECDGKNSAQMQDRANIYDKFLADFGITDSRTKTC